MQTRTIAVAVIIILAITTPLVITRYYLTPSSQQTVIDQMRATRVAATAAAKATPTALP